MPRFRSRVVSILLRLIMSIAPRKQDILAVVLGAGLPLGFAPYGWWPLTGVAAGGLYYLCTQHREGLARLCWWFAVGKNSIGISWVYVSISVYGDTSMLAAFAVVASLVALMSLFMLPVGFCFQRLRGFNPVLNLLLFCSLWLVSEWLFTWLLTGFPWLFAGYSLSGTLYSVYAPLFGVFGMSFILLLTASGWLELIRRYLPDEGTAPPTTKAPMRLVGVICIVAPMLGASALDRFGVQWVTSQGRYQVALVQGNIDQSIKWQPDQLQQNVERHIQLTEPYWEGDLILWPEFALTLYGQAGDRVVQRLEQLGQQYGANVIIGAPLVEWTPQEPERDYRIYNAAIGLGEASGRFSKHHLVPFGDYVPFEDALRGLIGFFDLPMSSTSAGLAQQPNVSLRLTAPDGVADTQVAIGICYEIAYGNAMRQRAEEAGLLVTLSNDTWFGESIGPHQHMQIAQMRALENGRWLLRATNNGITAIVDHRGVIRDQLPQFEEGVLTGEFEVMEGRTPYSSLGDWPLFWLIITILGVSWWFREASGRGRDALLQKRRSKRLPDFESDTSSDSEPDSARQ